MNITFLRRLSLSTVLLLTLFALGMCSFNTVATGHRGLKTRFGQVTSEALPEGLYFKLPFIEGFTTMDIRTIRTDGETMVYTKDIQQATITFTATYSLEPEKVKEVYMTVGSDWEEKLVPQILPTVLKNTTGKWDAVDLIAQRNKASAEILMSLNTNLNPKGIKVSDFSITNIDYADEFEKAVESKVTAIQRAAEAENKTKQIQEEAKQKVISAQAEAESMKIRSEALSQNKSLVEYEAVQKWDGKLPVYNMGNSTPFINLGGK